MISLMDRCLNNYREYRIQNVQGFKIDSLQRTFSFSESIVNSESGSASKFHRRAIRVSEA